MSKLALGLVSAAAIVACGSEGGGSAAAVGSGAGGAGGGSAAAVGGGGGAESAGFTASSSSGFGECAASSHVAKKAPVDVILVVDNSSSMSEEIDKVEANINGHFTGILGASSLDYKVVLISKRASGDAFEDKYAVCVAPPLGGPACADNPPKFRQVDRAVYSDDPLLAVLQTYTTKEPTLNWAGDLREDAYKFFVVVTDDDSTLSAVDFDQKLLATSPPGMFGKASDRRYVFFSIVGLETGKPDETCPTAVNPGKVYQELTALTGGEAFSMCEADYSPIFQAIAGRVNAAASCEYAIPAPPEGQTIDYGKINVEVTPGGGEASLLPNHASEGACGDAEGWYYDDPAAPQKISLCPASCASLKVSPGSETRVLVGCETIKPA